MDEQVFLQTLRDLPLAEGRTYIQQQLASFTDQAAIAMLIKDEASRQRDIHPFVSLKLAELLLFFGTTTLHLSARAQGFVAKGDALSVLAHEQAAMDNFDAAAAAFLLLDEPVNWARTRIGWIVSSAWLGHVEEALQTAAQAREVLLQHNALDRVCTLDHNTAVIYSQIGQYQKALELYDRILAIYPTLHNRDEQFILHAIALVKLNQGRNLSWLGNFEQARPLLLQARASFISLHRTGPLIRAEDSLANLDYFQGYYGSALRRYYHIRDLIVHHKLDDTDQLATFTLRIAGCLVKLNRAQEACGLAADAVAVYRKLGASQDTGNALLEYATVLISANRLKDASAIFDEAWTLFEQGGYIHHTAVIKMRQAGLLLEMGSSSAAYEQASQLKTYFAERGNVSGYSTILLIMAEALLKSAQSNPSAQGLTLLLQEATSLCEQVDVLARQHNLQEQGYKCLYLLGQVAALRKHLVEAEHYYAAALEQIERILNDLALDLRPAFLHTIWVVYEDIIAICLRQGRVERAFSYLERTRSLALRQYLNRSGSSHDVAGLTGEAEAPTSLELLRGKNAAILQMQSKLKEWQALCHYYSAQLANFDLSASPAIDQKVLKAELRRCETKVSELFERLHLDQAAATSTRPLPQNTSSALQPSTSFEDIPQLQQHLLPDQLLLTYFLYQGQLVIFAITRDRVVTHENPAGLVQLERLLPPLYARLEPAGWPDLQHPPLLATHALLQKLYALLIAPIAALLPPLAGSLTIVPYGLLHNLPFHALYNGTRFLIEDFQVSYLPATHLLTHLTAHSSSTMTQPPLIFGYSGHGNLQRALDEARTLASMLDGSCFLEEDATIDRLLEQAPGSPVIHLATHGKCRLDSPNFSYIHLADGQLNAIDAFDLHLESCQLVTLSGCETGLALSGGGDEQLGLGRAFLAAGASSLVMSLWPVEDESTDELMLLFYRNLLQGHSKVQALRAAQCSLLRQASSHNPHYSHPYFWAAFRLVGDISPLLLPKMLPQKNASPAFHL